MSVKRRKIGAECGIKMDEHCKTVPRSNLLIRLSEQQKEPFIEFYRTAEGHHICNQQVLSLLNKSTMSLTGGGTPAVSLSHLHIRGDDRLTAPLQKNSSSLKEPPRGFSFPEQATHNTHISVSHVLYMMSGDRRKME